MDVNVETGSTRNLCKANGYASMQCVMAVRSKRAYLAATAPCPHGSLLLCPPDLPDEKQRAIWSRTFQMH